MPDCRGVPVDEPFQRTPQDEDMGKFLSRIEKSVQLHRQRAYSCVCSRPDTGARPDDWRQVNGGALLFRPFKPGENDGQP